MNEKLAEWRAEEFGKHKKFEMVDPFNEGNTVSGWIGVTKGNYGNLLITQVNEEETFQTIHTTPKISYPFDRNGKWTLPPVGMMASYEKLDGTNIFMFRYEYNGEQYTSYKTRLQPFIQNGYFGAFLDMWKQMLNNYPRIPTLFEVAIPKGSSISPKPLTGFSFELYGSLNKHLIQYDVPLDTALLFAMREDEIVPLYELSHKVKSDVVPFAGIQLAAQRYDDYENLYKEEQIVMEEDIQDVGENEGETFTGDEGQIWYVCLEDGTTKMFKCKPESIESIHWEASSPIIHRNTIRTTAYNAAENSGKTNLFSTTKELLLEEFSQKKIYDSTARIHKIVSEVSEDLDRRVAVREWIEEEKIDVKTTELPTIMRTLSPHFKRDEMTRVYNITKEMKELYGV